MNQIMIGLAGKKFAGKDTAAQALVGFMPFKCASTLKEMTRTFLRKQGVSEEMIERLVEGDLKEVEVPWFGELKTSRAFQQKLGTEFGRNLLGVNVWINNELNACAKLPRVVFTDVRFHNECDAIKNAGGFVIRIKSKRSPTNEYSAHASEKEIDELRVNFEIDNDGTIEELHRTMRTLLLEIETEVSTRDSYRQHETRRYAPKFESSEELKEAMKHCPYTGEEA